MKVYEVAGLLFGVETRREDAMYRFMPNYRPFEVASVTDKPFLFRLSMDDAISLPATDADITFSYSLTEDSAVLRIYKDLYVLSISNDQSGETFTLECSFPQGFPGVAGKAHSFRSDLAAKSAPPPRHIVDHFLIFALSLTGLQYNTLLIHASTIVFSRQATLFLGESGTGKSTHSRMWLENIEGTVLLNDDAPAVRLVGGKAIAYGTPWSGKTHCYKAEQYSIAACVRIRRAPFNKLHRQPALTAFGAILPSALPTLQLHDSTLDEVCRILSGLVSSTPIYILDCLPNGNAAEVCRAGIFPA